MAIAESVAALPTEAFTLSEGAAARAGAAADESRRRPPMWPCRACGRPSLARLAPSKATVARTFKKAVGVALSLWSADLTAASCSAGLQACPRPPAALKGCATSITPLARGGRPRTTRAARRAPPNTPPAAAARQTNTAAERCWGRRPKTAAAALEARRGQCTGEGPSPMPTRQTASPCRSPILTTACSVAASADAESPSRVSSATRDEAVTRRLPIGGQHQRDPGEQRQQQHGQALPR